MKLVQFVIGGLIVTAMIGSGCGEENAQSLFDRGAGEFLGIGPVDSLVDVVLKF